MKIEQIKADLPQIHFTNLPQDLEKYGQDWSAVRKPAPSLIAFPRSTHEVSELLAYCSKQSIPVVPSGGRTGLSGGATAADGELVLSLEKMNRIGELDLASRTLHVEAGAITEAVHQFCEPHGLTWPVDFASKGSSHVGGNISTNAGGVRVIRYGLTRQWVLGLTVVTMNGDVLDLNGALEKNNTGIDLRQAFIGSEGTLGVVTEAILKLAPLPDAQKTRVCFFSLKDFQAVLKLFERARSAPFTLSAFECLDSKCMDEVVKFGLKNPTTQRGGAYVLLEAESTRADGSDLDVWLEKVFQDELVLDGVMAVAASEMQTLWALRERVAEAILSAGETHQQDLSVPISNLVEFAGDIVERYAKSYPHFETFIFGHIGDGNLHIFIRKPKTMESALFHHECEKSDEILFALTEKFKGSVSAEHGVGVLKKPALSYSRSPAEIKLFKSLKSVFDPKGLLNPGKII